MNCRSWGSANCLLFTGGAVGAVCHGQAVGVGSGMHGGVDGLGRRGEDGMGGACEVEARGEE